MCGFIFVCVCVCYQAVQLTGQHGEDGSKGVELESIDDVAGVEKLQTHETEADHQQQDVEHLRHHGQPQHTCKYTHAQLHYTQKKTLKHKEGLEYKVKDINDNQTKSDISLLSPADNSDLYYNIKYSVKSPEH